MIERMQYEIARVYPGINWVRKCYSMKDRQVMAIWHSFRERGSCNGRREHEEINN